MRGWVDVWTLRASAALADAAQAWLTPEELAARARIAVDGPRVEALVSRALLRLTLSRYATTGPRDWRFGATEHGRPTVDRALFGLSFNVSHAQGFVACAVGTPGELGVDVEDVRREIDVDSTARVSFSPRELDGLFALTGDARRARFFTLWTLKEAYLKARGAGLTMPLDGFSIDVDGSEPTIAFAPDFGDVATGWRFAQPDVGAHIQAAVAARSDVALDVRTHAVDPRDLGDAG